jgi:PKD repeat protein
MKTKNSFRMAFLALLLSLGFSLNAWSQVQAGFTYTINGQTVTFTNTTTGTSNPSWVWIFGDNTSATTMNAVHTYANNGIYTVGLEVFDPNGWDSINIPINIGNVSCNASYTASVNGQTVTFTNNSTTSSQYTVYQWNFGDNSYSSLTGPQHTYQYGGTYVVCLSMWDSVPQCSSTFCDTVTVAGPCQAGFTSSSYNDTAWFSGWCSTGGPNTQYSWDFGDNTSGTGQYPMHVYANSQYYNVCLYVYDNSTQCADTFCQSVFVAGPFVSTCNAAFSFTTNGSTATFTNTSTGITVNTGYYWSFGDGNYDYSLSPQHTYQYGGTYNVCLTLWDSAQSCNSYICQNVTVSGPPQPCNAYFITWPDTFNQYNYWAYNYSTGASPMSYSWNWGDGSPIDTLPYPSHTYTNPGWYTICLSITAGNGCTSVYCDSVLAQRMQASAFSVPITINVLSPTGIHEQQDTDLFRVFPNPASEVLYLDGTGIENGQYQVLNILGSTVLGGNISGNRIALHDIPAGTYFIRVSSAKGKVYVRPFIKN